MTTAVYIVTPKDNVDAFTLHARNADYEMRDVYIGKMVQDVRPVVFVDGSPSGLKNKLERGAPWSEAWRVLRKRVFSMLEAVSIGSEQLRLFVHFGGQGEEEVNNFNKRLRTLATEDAICRCYAISFGNKMPSDLFVNGEFSPPVGKQFWAMCKEMQDGTSDEFVHVRSLRLLLPNIKLGEDGEYDVSAIKCHLWDIYGGKGIDDVMSASERNLFTEHPDVLEKLHVDSSDGHIGDAKVFINSQDAHFLLKILARKETGK